MLLLSAFLDICFVFFTPPFLYSFYAPDTRACFALLLLFAYLSLFLIPSSCLSLATYWFWVLEGGVAW